MLRVIAGNYKPLESSRNSNFDLVLLVVQAGHQVSVGLIKNLAALYVAQ